MRRLACAATLGCLGAGCATPAAAPAPSADLVVAAEREFAADAAQSGWVAAFKRYAAADAIVIQPEPALAHESLAQLPPEANTRNLAWWPIWAGIAASGDLGFTTGPYAVAERSFGYYFTVWRREPDGSWKWVYDGGPRTAERPPYGPTTPPVLLPPSRSGVGSAGQALREVRALEQALASEAATDAPTAAARWLADDARIMGSPNQPATDARSRAVELASRPARIKFAALGASASAAGDLAFTYGHANWAGDAGPRRGYYVRIWQARPGGWRIVFDQLLAVPPKTGS